MPLIYSSRIWQDSPISLKGKWIFLKYLGHKKCNRCINKHSQTQSYYNQEINIFIISIKGFHGEICQHGLDPQRHTSLEVIYLMQKALLCKSNILFFQTCNHIVVHYWVLTSSFKYKMKMVTVGSHLRDLWLCNTTQHSISALFDECGQGHSIAIGSLTNHTLLLTQSEPTATLEMLCLIANSTKIYQCFYNDLILFKVSEHIHRMGNTIYKPCLQ